MPRPVTHKKSEMPKIEKKPEQIEKCQAPPKKDSGIFGNLETDDIILLIVIVALLLDDCDDKLLVAALGFVFISGIL